MKNAAKKVVFYTKKFVADHKVAVTVIATSTVWFWLNKAVVDQHNDFLKEKGLYEEFYTPSDEEM